MDDMVWMQDTRVDLQSQKRVCRGSHTMLLDRLTTLLSEPTEDLQPKFKSFT